MELTDLFDLDEAQPPKKVRLAQKPKRISPPPPSAERRMPAPPPTTMEDKHIANEFREDLLHWLVHGKTEPPRAPGLHCSSLWKTCPRVPLLEKKYADYIKIEPDTAGQRMTFDEGHALHDMIQNIYLGPFGRLWGRWKCLSCQEITHEGTMPGACPKCDIPWRNEEDGIQNISYAEMFVKDDDLKYCGHCDGILLTRAGRHVVFEFKTISKSQYGGLRQPKHEHVIQVHAYMNALDLRDAIILYWDKASQCDWKKTPDGWKSSNPHIKVFHVKWDQALWDNMVERIVAYHRARKRARELPVVEIEHINEYPRICTHKGCDLAGDCAVRDLCFAI